MAIDIDEHALNELSNRHPGPLLRCLVGDPTDEDVLARADLASARGLAAAMKKLGFRKGAARG